MFRVVQGTVSPGFGGLEMVIIEFHEWLLSQKYEAYVIAVSGSPLEKALRQRGHCDTVLAVSAKKPSEIVEHRKLLDSPQTAMVFHRQQGLKQLRFRKYQSKISLISHTFYDVRKKDLWHRWLFNRVDQWVVLTERHKKNLIETCPVKEEKIQIVPNGVDLKKFEVKFKAKPQENQVTHLGVIARLDPKKGQNVAIRALKELSASSPHRNWKLHFFGEDTPGEPAISPKLRKLAEELGLSDQIQFHGFEENIEKALYDLDVLWMPSVKETFGRCILEAMAAGVPVVASDAGGVPDIIDDRKNGILFQTLNPKDLAHKTIELINEPGLFEQIQRRGRLDAELRFDKNILWPRLLKTILPTSTMSMANSK
jgi:glycosyltransferase involved in cell wall biosynthesis